jgi:hypothetical protein
LCTAGKGYFFSWRDPALKDVQEDWLGGRNYCRQRCMDLISLETSAENEWIKKRIVDEKASRFFFAHYHPLKNVPFSLFAFYSSLIRTRPY